MLQEVLSALEDYLPPSANPTPTTTLNSLDLYGTDLIEMSFVLEDKFDISILDKEMEQWKTIGDIMRTVETARPQ